MGIEEYHGAVEYAGDRKEMASIRSISIRDKVLSLLRRRCLTRESNLNIADDFNIT